MKKNQHIEPENLRAYRIIRFRNNGQTQTTIKTKLTLSEAQAWCSREDTHETGKWFDGYDTMKGIESAD